MFKRSIRRIVAAIMSVLALLFLGMLAVIYGFSYYDMRISDREILERYAATYTLKGHSKEDFYFGDDTAHGFIPSAADNPINGNKKYHWGNTHKFKLSTFYSVAISKDGEILAVDIADETFYEQATLEKYALEILNGGKEDGVKGELMYLVSDKGGYTLVTFIDNAVMQGNMITLFRYTLIFGGVAIAALFFVAVYLAKRIVIPLEESYRKQKQFISDAGHELKTPVSVVSANAELLSREIGDNQWLSNIQYENERMGKLVIQLLELARTENADARTEHLDFSRLVSGEALPFESIAFEKGLALNCDIAPELFVEGNSGQLKQLVSILLDNAISHGTGGKEIALTLRADRRHLILSVVNAGEPIPEEQTEQMFERFYRADTSRNDDGGHYGLGLAIAKAIVTAHKGRIEVSCYDGLVEFKVTVPV